MKKLIGTLTLCTLFISCVKQNEQRNIIVSASGNPGHIAQDYINVAYLKSFKNISDTGNFISTIELGVSSPSSGYKKKAVLQYFPGISTGYTIEYGTTIRNYKVLTNDYGVITIFTYDFSYPSNFLLASAYADYNTFMAKSEGMTISFTYNQYYQYERDDKVIAALNQMIGDDMDDKLFTFQ
jgi:hypothetical protein